MDQQEIYIAGDVGGTNFRQVAVLKEPTGGYKIVSQAQRLTREIVMRQGILPALLYRSGVLRCR